MRTDRERQIQSVACLLMRGLFLSFFRDCFFPSLPLSALLITHSDVCTGTAGIGRNGRHNRNRLPGYKSNSQGKHEASSFIQYMLLRVLVKLHNPQSLNNSQAKVN